MEFFEFFFSGPGWGWKVFALICLISVFCDLIIKSINMVLNHKIKKFEIEIAELAESLKHKNDNKDNDEGTPATIDDVRS